MAKRIQPKLSRPRANVIASAGWHAGLSMAEWLLLSISCCYHTVISEDERQTRRDELPGIIAQLRDFAVLTGHTTAEEMLRFAARAAAEDYAQHLDEALALVGAAPTRRAA